MAKQPSDDGGSRIDGVDIGKKRHPSGEKAPIEEGIGGSVNRETARMIGSGLGPTKPTDAPNKLKKS